MNKKLIIVAAHAINRAIGMNGRMPWHLPDELQHFKKITLGKPVLMGRKTWQAISRPLPGRQNIVISRNLTLAVQGAELAMSLEAAIEIADGDELMVIGGGEIYRLALPLARRLALTVVNCNPQADTWFPRWSRDDWKLTDSIHHPADERHEFSFEMQNWIRADD